MGVPVITGDSGGPYTFPSTPPLVSSFTMVSGSAKTFIAGKSIMLLGAAITTGGPIAVASLTSLKTFVEGRPVLLAGAVTHLSTGWLGGVLLGGGAANVQVN